MTKGLTDRELQCVYLAGGLGLSDKIIARRLDIGTSRVSKLLSSAYRKLGVSDRRTAYERGIRSPGVTVPLQDAITLATDWERPGGVPGEETIELRPWLARHWRPPPKNRLAILSLILACAIASLALMLGGVAITRSLLDAVNALGRMFF